MSFIRKIQALSYENQAYLAAMLLIASQYVLNALGYYNLLPEVAGKSLSGIANNMSYVIPGTLAIFGSLFFGGTRECKTLLGSYKTITFNPLWWILAATILIPFTYVAVWADNLLYGRPDPIGILQLTIPDEQTLTKYTPIFVQVAISDELFWIGFVLPRLIASNYSPLKASLIIGILWGWDYIPYLFTDFLVAENLNLANLVFGWLALTPIYVWLYHKTRSPLILVFFNTCMQYVQNGIPVLPHDNDGNNAPFAMANLLCFSAGLLLWKFFPNGKSYDLSHLRPPGTVLQNKQ